MRYQFAALAISGLAITGAIFMNPGEAHAREAGSGKTHAREAGSGKTTATAPAPVNPGKNGTNSGKNAVKPIKTRP